MRIEPHFEYERRLLPTKILTITSFVHNLHQYSHNRTLVNYRNSKSVHTGDGILKARINLGQI